MTATEHAEPATLLDRLIRQRLRPGFQSVVIAAPVGHPVLGLPPCRVPGCELGARTRRGLCGPHGTRWERDGRPVVDLWAAAAEPRIHGQGQLSGCAVDGCRFGHAQNDLCSRHHAAWTRAGRPEWLAWIGQQHGSTSDGHVICAVEGCELLSETVRRPLCHGHQDRWRRLRQPPLDEFVIDCAVRGRDVFDLRGLSPSLQLEVQYGLQCRVEQRRVKTQPCRLAALFRHLAREGVVSLRQRPPSTWRAELREATGLGWANTAVAFVCDTLERLDDLQTGVGWDSEFPRDVWRFKQLGLPSDRSATLRFDRIDPPWLRALAKRWLRWRLTTGTSTSQAGKDLLGLTRFARFLHESGRVLDDASALDRELIERFLAWLSTCRPNLATRRSDIGALAAFLRALHQHRWAPELPTTATIYIEDYPRQPRPEARALSEFVATQLEAEENLARIDDPRIRLLTEVLQRTGLRIGDARRLDLDCLIRDSQGAPYLRYRNHKMGRDAHVPVDDRLADHVARQQAVVGERWPAGTCLFPMLVANPDGNRPISRGAYAKQLNEWVRRCDIRTESGKPATVTPHQWRHTYATRLINNGVPQNVVKKLLDHDSDTMTAHYARLSLETVRDQWEQATKVDITGAAVTEDSGALADAVWLKNSLARAKMALPNGYCTLPLQQTCEYANACLTCPMFLTTTEFLPEHHRQLTETRKVIASAQERGQERVIEMNRTVETNLNRIILTLERSQGPCGAGCSGGCRGKDADAG